MNQSVYTWDTSLILKSIEISGTNDTLPGHIFTGFPANGNTQFQRHSELDRNEYFFYVTILLDQFSSRVSNRTMLSQNLYSKHYAMKAYWGVDV
jgi:hypothetical protein